MSKELQARVILNQLCEQFSDIGIDTPALDARLLLEAISNLDQAKIIMEPLVELTLAQRDELKVLVARRMTFEPIAKILGQKEFYGRAFMVSKDVLDPRPDTETLIDVVLKHEASTKATFLDIGTGSGAIAITLLCENGGWRGVATDISDLAIDVAQKNAQNLGVDERLTFRQTSWAQGIDGKFDFLVSNPPYIARAEIETLAHDVKNFDPQLALDGGEDGLEAYRQIAMKCGALLNKGGRIYLEIGYLQARQVVDLFVGHGFAPFVGQEAQKVPESVDCVVKDLAGNDRVVVMVWGA